MIRLAAAVVAGLVWATGAAAAPAPSVVKVETGRLQGVAGDGVVAFKGVPFAAPPVGALRWRPPQPAKAWSGVRPALANGKDCLQGPIAGDPGLGTDLAEDCLYLNVWRPAQASAKPLPVMVWIYGGGLVNGGTQPAIYQGDGFARHGVVFVSINYRLGRFGFFAHPALSGEHTGELKANYGYMDQLAALQWVKRNIAAFGGDPNTVTVFGESAGGYSVHTLLATPLAAGLFQRAIVESGGGRDQLGAAPDLTAAEAIGLAFAKSQGIDGADAAALAKLRALPAAAVTGDLSMRTMRALMQVSYSGPVRDGKLVAETPGEAYRDGRHLKVALMAGANGADLGINGAPSLETLLAPFGANKDAALAAYDPSAKRDLAAMRTLIGRDQTMLEPARYAVARFAADGLPAYEYRFDYVGEALRTPATKGAAHASEIPYVFGKYGAPYIAMVSPTHAGEASARDLAVSQTLQGYWLNFAKTGDPNGAELPEWKRYEAGSDAILLIDANGAAKTEADPWKPRLDVIAASRP